MRKPRPSVTAPATASAKKWFAVEMMTTNVVSG
jgi:hypothetical protein